MVTTSIDIHRLSPEEKFRLYNEHAPEALDRLVRTLSPPPPLPVILLAGPPGCGRTGLLEAAAQLAGIDRIVALDLDGWEEGGDLGRFAEVQIARRWELDEPARETLRQKIQPIVQFIPSSSSTGAVLVSLLLRHEDPAAVWRELPGAAADARLALSALLTRLAQRRKGLLHVLVSDALNDPLRRWLLDWVRQTPSLTLVFSCSQADTDERVAPRIEQRRRFDLQPLPAGGLLDPVHELFHGLEMSTADRLQRFLDLAALCGPNVPPEVLFHHLELDDEQKEAILDLIDEELVENEDLRLFIDHQYGHPSFPGLLTYGFLSPRINHAFLEPLPVAKRERLAGELLEFLNRSVPMHTRGMTLLRLSLAGHLPDDQARHFFQRELRVWISEGEVADLTAELMASVAAGQATVHDLLATAQQTAGHWPSHYRLAFLDAARARSGDLSPAERVELHNQRAEALRDVQRLPEAVEDARLALADARAVHGPEHPTAVRALNLLGILLRETGNPEEGRESLKEALAIHGKEGQEDDNLANILANLGMIERDLGDREAARDHLERALAIHRRTVGDAHPIIANDLNNLAILEQELGRPERALEHLQPVVDIVRRLYGDVHPETSRALTNVAGLLRNLGQTNAARLHVDAALQVDRQVFGPAHPQVAADLNNLAVLERELGDSETARAHFEEALAIAQATFGEEHPLTAQLRHSLAEEG